MAGGRQHRLLLLFVVVIVTKLKAQQIINRETERIITLCPLMFPEMQVPTCTPTKVRDTSCGNAGNDTVFGIRTSLRLDRFYEIQDVTEILRVSGSLQLSWYIPCNNYSLPVASTTSSSAVSYYLDEALFWTPHFTHRNAAKDYGLKDGFTSRLYMTPKRDQELRFYWQHFGVFESTCEMDFQRFPFDVQTCEIHLTLLDSNSVITFATDDSAPSPEFMGLGARWRLMNFTVHVGNYTFLKNNRSLIAYKMVFRRKASFYVINLMLPALFLSALEVSSLFMQSVLPDRPTFCVTLMLAFTVLQAQILTWIPAKPQNIFLGDYTYLCAIFSWMITFYTLATCFIAREWRKWSKTRVASMPFYITRSRLLDLIAAFVAVVFFIYINATPFQLVREAS